MLANDLMRRIKKQAAPPGAACFLSIEDYSFIITPNIGFEPTSALMHQVSFI